MALVTYDEIVQSGSTLNTVTSTEGELVQTRLGKTRRTALVIQNLSAGTLTITFGDTDTVANTGIVLTQYGTWQDTEDSTHQVYQGAVHAVGSTTLSVSVTEIFARN